MEGALSANAPTRDGACAYDRPIAPLRVLYLHERPAASGSTVSLALTIDALGDAVDPWIVTPRGPAALVLGRSGRVLHRPTAGLMHIWSGVYSGTRWALLAANVVALPRHLVALRRVLREVRPDVVHVNDVPQLPSALLARRLGFPVVLHLRAALPVRRGGWRSALVRRAVRSADAAIAINDDVAESYGRPRNVVVVPNPVRPAPLSPNGVPAASKAALGLPADRAAIGFVGPLLDYKGWPQLLEAVAELVAKRVPVTVALVGASPRPAAWHRSLRGRMLGALSGRRDGDRELRAAVDRLGLHDHVRVLGWREDVAQVYAALDVVCAPSQGPELSRAVLEGQAHGRAVVAVSRGGGGIVEPEVTGLLVESASPERLAQVLRRLVEDPALRDRLGSAARSHAEREYSPEVVGRRLAAVYERVRR